MVAEIRAIWLIELPKKTEKSMKLIKSQILTFWMALFWEYDSNKL